MLDAARGSEVPITHRHLWRITLVVAAALLALMPAPVRVTCMVHAVGTAPQPLAEPCDSVLLSHNGVSVNLIAFDVAPALLGLYVAGATWLLQRSLSDELVFAPTFNLIPDPPPPRIAAA